MRKRNGVWLKVLQEFWHHLPPASHPTPKSDWNCFHIRTGSEISSLSSMEQMRRNPSSVILPFLLSYGISQPLKSGGIHRVASLPTPNLRYKYPQQREMVGHITKHFILSYAGRRNDTIRLKNITSNTCLINHWTCMCEHVPLRLVACTEVAPQGNSHHPTTIPHCSHSFCGFKAPHEHL